MGNRKIQSQKFEAPLFERHLRRAILNVPSKARVSPFIFMKRLFPVMTLVGLLLTLGLIYNFSSEGRDVPDFIMPSQASAQELVLQVSEQIQALTPEEVSTLEEEIGVPDLNTVLQEAQKAQDLRDLPLNEESLLAADGKEYCTVMLDKLWALASDRPACASYFEGLRPVAFTSSDGSFVIILVNESLLPYEIFSFNATDDSSGTSSIFTIRAQFPTWEEASHFSTISFPRDASLEENKAELIQALPSMFEQAVEPDHSHETEEGMIGGGVEE